MDWPQIGNTNAIVHRFFRYGVSAVLVGTVCLQCQVSSGELPAEAAPIVPTVSQIVESIRQSRQTVSSLRIVTDRFTAMRAGKALDEPEYFGNADFAFHENRRVLATKQRPVGPIVVTTIAGTETLTVDEAVRRGHVKEFAEETRQFDGTYFSSRRGARIAEVYTAKSIKESGGSNFDVLYLRSIGWFVSDPTSPDEFDVERRDLSLPDVLERATYEISIEDLRDFDCVRLESSFVENDGRRTHRRFWLARDYGYMLVRRDYTDADDQLIARVDASEPVEIAPGVWVPKECSFFYDSSGSVPPNPPDATDLLRLVDWQVNTVDDALFKIEIAPNSLVIDHISLPTPDGKAIVRNSGADVQTLDQAADRAKRGKSWLLWGNLSIIAIIVAIIALRRIILRR